MFWFLQLTFQDEQMDPSVTETYMGEWKNDKRSGFGISERSDGLKYEGEWYANKKYGYGVTTFSNGEKEEGKYKNNVLITSQKKKLFLMRSAKFRERIDAAVNAAQRASKIALQKADIAISRMATARGKAEQADLAAAQAREDSEVAGNVAKQYAPDFKQPGFDRLKARREKFQLNSDIINSKDSQNTNLTPNQVSNPPNLQSDHVPNKPHNQITFKDSYQTVQKIIANKPQNQISFKESQMYQTQATPPFGIDSTLQNHNSAYNNPGPPNSISVNEFGPQSHNELSGNKPRNSLPQDEITPQVNNLRRNSRRISADRPYLGNVGQQSSIDHFDHYKRPPSRDSSVDRYSRAAGRLDNSLGSRQPSVERTSRPSETPDRYNYFLILKIHYLNTNIRQRNIRAPSVVRGTTPNPTTKNGAVLTGSAAKLTGNSTKLIGNNINSTESPPFEEIIIRKRGLGQDIIPSPNQPKRTESLFIPGAPVQQPKQVSQMTQIIDDDSSIIFIRKVTCWVNLVLFGIRLKFGILRLNNFFQFNFTMKSMK